MISEALEKQLNDYLRGKLNREEADNIRSRIEREEDVREAYAALKLELALARIMDEDAIGDKLDGWWAEAAQQKSSPGLMRRPLLFVLLAGVLLLAALIAWYLNGQASQEPPPNTPTPLEIKTDRATEGLQLAPPDTLPQEKLNPVTAPPIAPPVASESTSPSPQLLAANALSEEEYFTIFRGTSLDTLVPSDAFAAAKFYLERKNWAASLDSLARIDSSQVATFLPARQLAAFIHLQQQDYAEAIPILRQILATPYLDEDRHRRLLGLSLVATGESQAGIDTLKQLVETGKNQREIEAARAFIKEL